MGIHSEEPGHPLEHLHIVIGSVDAITVLHKPVEVETEVNLNSYSLQSIDCTRAWTTETPSHSGLMMTNHNVG